MTVQDENYRDWRPGDRLCWLDGYSEDPGEVIILDEINEWDRVYWTDAQGQQYMTRACNMVRVREVEENV